jgi:hypothetical protein
LQLGACVFGGGGGGLWGWGFTVAVIAVKYTAGERCLQGVELPDSSGGALVGRVLLRGR